MRMRWVALIGAAALVGFLALTGIGVARAWGSDGFAPWAMGRHAMPYGNGSMMGHSGQYGPGGMMGGGMMGGSGVGQARDPSSAAPVTGNAVTIVSYAYQPVNLQVKVGTTVTWTNQDSVAHTVTFRDSSLKSSGLLRQGDSYTYTFTKAGTYLYYCAVHPNMTAQVTVTA